MLDQMYDMGEGNRYGIVDYILQISGVYYRGVGSNVSISQRCWLKCMIC